MFRCMVCNQVVEETYLVTFDDETMECCEKCLNSEDALIEDEETGEEILFKVFLQMRGAVVEPID